MFGIFNFAPFKEKESYAVPSQVKEISAQFLSLDSLSLGFLSLPLCVFVFSPLEMEKALRSDSDDAKLEEENPKFSEQEEPKIEEEQEQEQEEERQVKDDPKSTCQTSSNTR